MAALITVISSQKAVFAEKMRRTGKILARNDNLHLVKQLTEIILIIIDCMKMHSKHLLEWTDKGLDAVLGHAIFRVEAYL